MSHAAAVVQIKHLLGVFARHVGNRGHAVVDRAHLRELSAQLDRHADAIASEPALAPVVAAVSARRQLVANLLAELDAAAAVLPPPDARATLASQLAERANQQFRLHANLVAGRPHARPALIDRIATNLADIESAMGALPAASLSNPAQHANNLALVARERARIESTRPAPVGDAALVELLTAAAATERQTYLEAVVQRDRSLVELDRVGGIADRLGELAYQLARLPGEAARVAYADVIAQLEVAETMYQSLVDERQQTPGLGRVVASADALRQQLLAADAPERVRQEAVARLDALLADPLVVELAGPSAGQG